MYYKNLLIGIAALTLAVTTALADCTDPSDPSCTCTNNCGDPTNSPADPYPPGSLQLHAQGGTITVTNGDLWTDYQFQTSTDNVSWAFYGDVFEVGTDTTYTVSFAATDSQRFFRIVDVTTTESETVFTQSSSPPCGIPGFPIAHAAYGKMNLSAFFPYTNMVRFAIIDPNRTNDTLLQFVGHLGDIDCGVTNRLVIPFPVYSDRYTFADYFKTNIPASPYTDRFKGFHR